MRHVVPLTRPTKPPSLSGRGRGRVKALELFVIATFILAGCSKPIAPADEVAPQKPIPATSSNELLYDGLTVAQWQDRIKLIDPADPQSAAHVPGLIALVRDRNVPAVTRRRAAHTLGRMGAPAKAAVPVLIELLSEPPGPEESTVFWSAKGLALFGPVARDAAPALIDILHSESQPTANREAAVEALTRIGTAHPRVVTTLVELLQTSSSSDDSQAAIFRAEAAASLGLMGSGASTAVPALIRATRDEREPVRLQSVIALGAVGRQAEVAIPGLVDALLTDDSPSVRDEAATALAKIGPSSVPALIQLLADQEADVRERAASGLRRMGRSAKPAANAVTRALDDESPQVSIAAAEALWAITADASKVVPALVRALTDEDRQIRIRALRQVIAMGSAARLAIEPIKSLTHDPRPQVRRAATEALKKLEHQK